MTSLTTKRRLAYEHSMNRLPNISLDATQINLNTDELETKLDTIINNTYANKYSLNYSTTIAGNATDRTTAIDFGTSLDIHKIQVVGTTTHNNTDCILEVSEDNITYYELSHHQITIVGTKISGSIDINFRYCRVAITDNTGNPITVNLLVVAKNY
tara:strand:- start:1134 stop:1601 length:468 start_codon:yes stop_codon:yes gene_type:complete